VLSIDSLDRPDPSKRQMGARTIIPFIHDRTVSGAASFRASARR
jgi:hypothetical protein